MQQDDTLLDGHNSEYPPVPQPNPESKYDGLASLLIIVGFMVVIAINFFRSLSSNAQTRNAILNRQVELLNQLKQETNEDDMQNLLSEYDSLSTVLSDLEQE